MTEAWFDGACEPFNPGGHAAFGVIIRKGMETVCEKSGYVGFGQGMSNNVAEYCGAIFILKYLDEHPDDAVVYGDSQLVIRQLSGAWKAKAGLYVPYHRVAQDIIKRLIYPVSFQWIAREDNTECDRLSKLAAAPQGAT